MLKELTDKSEKSAQQINNMIEKITEKTESKVAQIINHISEIKQTEDSLINSMDIFRDIELRVQQMIGELENIATSVKGVEENQQLIEVTLEQTTQISESNLVATQKVATTFEQQYATLELLTAAARNLKLMSENFNHLARRFML